MMTNLSLHKPVKREKQRMKINLKNEGNLVCVSISPYLTSDTLFIKEDFLPMEFNEFFCKMAITKVRLSSWPAPFPRLPLLQESK